jgi:hypothetical protein
MSYYTKILLELKRSAALSIYRAYSAAEGFCFDFSNRTTYVDKLRSCEADDIIGLEMSGRCTVENIENLFEKCEPWLQYAIALNFQTDKKDDLERLREKALADPRIKGFLADVADYHGIIVSGHKNPALPVHKLLFLLDLGFDLRVPEIQEAINQILSHQDEHGVYQSAVNIPLHFGGSGVDTFGWSPCDAPLLLRALCLAGVDYQKHIKQGVDQLVSLNRTSGFPCASSKELGKWRGPGRKEECCPYTTLIFLKLLLATPEYAGAELTRQLALNLLDLWENSRESHPYMFFMGTDFRKLKAPTLWFDIVSVCKALSYVKGIENDARFREMLNIIQTKETKDGMFIPESVYLKLSDWDFGQKKVPSPYLTYTIHKIFRRKEMKG